MQPDVAAEFGACVGVQAFFEGEFIRSRAVLEHALVLFERRAGTDVISPRWPLPNDPLTATLTHLGVMLWLAGDPDRADATLRRARERAARLPFPSGPFSEAYAYAYSGWISTLDGRFTDGVHFQEQALQISDRYGFPFWTATCKFHAAVSGAHLGDASSAIEIAEERLSHWRALGAEAFVPCKQTHLADIRLGLGDLDEAMRLVDEAIASAEERGERFFLAESHRVRATILRRRGGVDAEVRQELETSRTIAAGQGALMFELRALADLVEVEGAGADADDLRRLLDRLPAASRPLRDVDRARAILAAGQRAGAGGQAGAGGSS